MNGSFSKKLVLPVWSLFTLNPLFGLCHVTDLNHVTGDDGGGQSEALCFDQKLITGWTSQVGGRSGPFVSTGLLSQGWHFIPQRVLQFFSQGICSQDFGSLSENFHSIPALSGALPSSDRTSSLLPDLALGQLPHYRGRIGSIDKLEANPLWSTPSFRYPGPHFWAFPGVRAQACCLKKLSFDRLRI